jgi:hypothetical protein
VTQGNKLWTHDGSSQQRTCAFVWACTHFSAFHDVCVCVCVCARVCAVTAGGVHSVTNDDVDLDWNLDLFTSIATTTYYSHLKQFIQQLLISSGRSLESSSGTNWTDSSSWFIQIANSNCPSTAPSLLNFLLLNCPYSCSSSVELPLHS